jgi:hypothetical protein
MFAALAAAILRIGVKRRERLEGASKANSALERLAEIEGDFGSVG